MPPFFSISIILSPALSGKPVPLLFSFSNAFVSGGSMEMWQMRPCAHKLCQILYFPRNLLHFPPLPHLQQHAQTENALIFHCSKAAVIRRFPPPAARVRRSGCKRGPSLLFSFPYVQTITTDWSRTFQNTVSLLLLLTAHNAKMAGLVGWCLLQVGGVKDTSGHMCFLFFPSRISTRGTK